jgi:hypothetical protein
MADDADRAGPEIDRFIAESIAAARGEEIKLVSGECDYCGHNVEGGIWKGLCAGCREDPVARKWAGLDQ